MHCECDHSYMLQKLPQWGPDDSDSRDALNIGFRPRAHETRLRQLHRCPQREYWARNGEKLREKKFWPDRFFNWAPLFIRVQIFQIHFFGDEMHSSPLELSRKMVELKVCECFKYFTQILLRKYLNKNICSFKIPVSSCKFYFLNIFCNSWVKSMGHHLLKEHFDKYTFFHWEIRPHFWTFFDLKNTLMPTSTYSTLMMMVRMMVMIVMMLRMALAQIPISTFSHIWVFVRQYGIMFVIIVIIIIIIIIIIYRKVKVSTL